MNSRRLHAVIFDKSTGKIHCENCDYHTGDRITASIKGCINFAKSIEHCDGCYKKEIIVETKRLMRQRLAVDVPEAVHKELKLIAIKHNCTITKYVLRTLLMAIQREKDIDQ